jgi:molybdopterin-guanine dinucleotide biosynthesis protein A
MALAGIFVGGPGRRMGGRPKGLLEGPGGVTLVERWRALLGGLGVEVVLVGDAAAYAGMGLPALADEPAGVGPLGGLVALLRRAADRPALAVACDMPFVSQALVARLLAAPGAASIVAPRRDGRWEPLCARYDPARVLPLAVARAASPYHSLQRLLEDAGAAPLPLAPHEAAELRDWDSPDDVGP